MTIFLLCLALSFAASTVYMLVQFKKVRQERDDALKAVAETNRKMIEADSKCICRGLTS